VVGNEIMDEDEQLEYLLGCIDENIYEN